VAALLPFFADPSGDSGVMSHMRREIEWRIGTDRHRPALPSLWVQFALMLDGLVEADERKTRALCRDGLERIGWTGDTLEEKKRQLDDGAVRRRQNLDDIG